MKSKTSKIFGLILLSVIWVKCSNRETENKSQKDISVINSHFPLELDKIDLTNPENSVYANDRVNARIEQTIKNYYRDECLNDSLTNYKDTYIGTIHLSDSLNTLYVVLLKNYPTEELNAKILFYNNQKKDFLDETLDFKIYALFDFENHKLKASNFKSILKIDTPQIALVDFDKDGIHDFKFTRLFHNGTFNSFHTTILTIKNSTLDTLDFKEQAIGQF